MPTLNSAPSGALLPVATVLRTRTTSLHLEWSSPKDGGGQHEPPILTRVAIEVEAPDARGPSNQRVRYAKAMTRNKGMKNIKIGGL
jgi:hypothetical protein